jgi:hypothetical protein
MLKKNRDQFYAPPTDYLEFYKPKGVTAPVVAVGAGTASATAEATPRGQKRGRPVFDLSEVVKT